MTVVGVSREEGATAQRRHPRTVTMLPVTTASTFPAESAVMLMTAKATGSKGVLLEEDTLEL